MKDIMNYASNDWFEFSVGNDLIIANEYKSNRMFLLKITKDYQVTLMETKNFYLYFNDIGPTDIFFFGSDTSRMVHVYYFDKNDQLVDILFKDVLPEDHLMATNDLVMTVKNLSIYQVSKNEIKLIKKYDVSNCLSVSYDGVYIACIENDLYKLFKLENFNLRLICITPFIEYPSSYMFEDENSLCFTGYNSSYRIYEYQFGNSYLNPSSYTEGQMKGGCFTKTEGDRYNQFTAITKRFGYQNYKKVGRLPGQWETNFRGDYLFTDRAIATIRK